MKNQRFNNPAFFRAVAVVVVAVKCISSFFLSSRCPFLPCIEIIPKNAVSLLRG